MSIKIMSRVWEYGPEKQADRFVLLAISDYANDDGECWPSIAGICRKTCMSERGVQTIIRRLECEGWLEIETGKGRRNCNLYTVKTPHHMHPAPHAPPHIDVETPHMDAINPAPHAPEPSYNHHKPSSSSSADVDFDLLTEVLSAVGLKGGRIPTYWLPPAASIHVSKWVSDLGLSHDEIITAAHESRKQFDTPPNGPKALDRVMQNLSASKQAPTLSPSKSNGAKNDRARHCQAINQLADKLSSGEARIDYSDRDPFAHLR